MSEYVEKYQIFIEGLIIFIVAGLWVGDLTKSLAEDLRALDRIRLETTSQKAEQRLALVIGNSAYTFAPLRNPVNDAKAIATALREFGFEVIERHNADRQEMRRALREFEEKLRNKHGVGLFYYAGHGIQVNNRNYLIPLDADIKREFEVPDEALIIDSILRAIQLAGNDLNIVILDACRNNPFERSFRSTTQGLAQMDAPTGTLIAYATAPGQVASDGSGEHGLYTAALLKHMQEPGLKIEDVLKQVRMEVSKATHGEQVPWVSTSLMGDFYFLRTPSIQTPSDYPFAYNPDPKIIELVFWETIKDSKNPVLFQAYLERYPEGMFTAIAKVKINATQTIHKASGSQDKKLSTPSSLPSAEVASNNSTKPIEPLIEQITPVEQSLHDFQNRPQALPQFSPKQIEDSINLSKERRREAQVSLTLLGFDTQGFDGVFGDNTRAAIIQFQNKNNFKKTGYFTSEQIKFLFDNSKELLIKWRREQQKVVQAAKKEKQRHEKQQKARLAPPIKQKTQNQPQEQTRRVFGTM